jgi:hypothetical protein
MAPIGQSVSEYDDVYTDSYVSGSVSVGASQVQAKVGASNLVGREFIVLQNQGPQVVYYGPSGVTTTTGCRLEKNELIGLPIGASVNIYLIAAGAGNTVIVQEMA